MSGVKVICIVVVATLFHFGSEFVQVGVGLKILSVGVREGGRSGKEKDVMGKCYEGVVCAVIVQQRGCSASGWNPTTPLACMKIGKKQCKLRWETQFNLLFTGRTSTP